MWNTFFCKPVKYFSVGKRKMQSIYVYVFLFYQNKSFNPKSTSREPPRLVVVVEDSGDTPDVGFIFSDGCIIECSSDCLHDMFMSLMHCYYAWQLNYPRQYQLLGFLQEHMIHEDQNMNFFKSVPYVQFNKKLKEV